MTSSKLLFDENIPPDIVADLVGLLRHARDEESAQLKHVHQLYAEIGLTTTQGVWDEKWVPAIANQEWTVLAGDRGQSGGKGMKLPILCATHKITLFMLSPAVHRRHKFRKLLTILSVWHELLELANSERGLQFQIEPHSAETASCARGKIVRKSLPKTYPTPPGMLFPK